MPTIKPSTIFLIVFTVWSPFWFFLDMADCEDKPSADSFYQQQKRTEAEWDAMRNDTQQAWAILQKQAEHNWAAFVQSTQKEWVDYDRSMDTRSRVDFEKGKIEIETVLPDDSPATMEEAEKKILAKTKAVLAKTHTADQTILDNQVTDSRGQKVTPQNLDSFLSGDLLPRIAKDPEPYITKDGNRRTRYSVSIDLVPEHIDIRARQFLPLVISNAKKFNLDPRLIMAIIHTESYFNPLAISGSGAVGLMQVMPKYAGREAYNFLYGEDWAIEADYLYSPGINIELGSAYLHLLINRYFAYLTDPDKRRFVTICAYNWGPTAVQKKVLNRYATGQMDASALYALLCKKTPEETREYLKKVTERMGLYDPYFRT